jgi:hypothetical protein
VCVCVRQVKYNKMQKKNTTPNKGLYSGSTIWPIVRIVALLYSH